jgi:hypothetical protein
MTTESLNAVHTKHGVLVRERENLGLFLHHLCTELADHCCQIDEAEDSEFAYLDIKLGWVWDDIDISVRGGHVVVRMVRVE